LATPAIGGPFTPTAAFLAEVITTFFLAYVIFGTLVDKRGSTTVGALVVGLAITTAILATGNVSGAAMNPARWFGPALISGHLENAWIWICGPLIGASLAAALYYYGYMRGKAAE
jgi:aquaporin Z